MAAVKPEAPVRRLGNRSFLIIGLVLGMVVVALYIGTQVIGVLLGIAMPPSPPVPNNATEVSHISDEYGVDRWEYIVSSEVCSVVSFYESNGGVCSVAQPHCGSDDVIELEPHAVAQCTGEDAFSIFSMHWSVVIYHNSAEESYIDLSREVFWIGTGPTTTPHFDFDEPFP
jgi:hypothetical protein